MIDVLLAVSLVGLVLVLARFVLRPSGPRIVGITVRAGRQISVNGQSFPGSGPSGSEAYFPVPFKDLVRPGNEIELTIVPTPGGAETAVAMQRRGTKTLNIDASHETQIIVYAGREESVRRSTAAAVSAKCIWCRNGVIVCGLMPKCP